MTMAIRVLIVDDHAAVRAGLRALLRRDPDLDVIDEAENVSEAIEKARRLRPDVVLMDLFFPGSDGIAAMSTIRSEIPETEVVVLTSVMEQSAVAGAIRAGAIGYLLKDVRSAELRSAIKAAAIGQLHLSPQASQYLLGVLRSPQPTEPLTERELEVLHLLVRGYSNREVALALDIAEYTVKTYARHILAKLKVHSRTEAILVAMRLGIIPHH